MADTKEVDSCPVCILPMIDCICCPGWGHVCPLDEGEAYCPVCLPELKDGPHNEW